MLDDGQLHNGEAVGVMGEQLVDARRKGSEPPLVRREDLLDIQIADGAERVQEVGERVAGLLGVD